MRKMPNKIFVFIIVFIHLYRVKNENKMKKMWKSGKKLSGIVYPILMWLQNAFRGFEEDIHRL